MISHPTKPVGREKCQLRRDIAPNDLAERAEWWARRSPPIPFSSHRCPMTRSFFWFATGLTSKPATFDRQIVGYHPSDEITELHVGAPPELVVRL